MSQCLHCGKLCAEHTAFCAECQERARELFHQDEPEQFAFAADVIPLTPAMPASPSGEEEEEFPGALTLSNEPADAGAEVSAEVSALVADGGLNSADEAVSRLSAAARWIAGDEPGESRLKRSARLTPLRDISADIQRASTPHPSLRRSSDFDTQPGSEVSQVVDHTRRGHGAWPWFVGEEEEEEPAGDVWANSTDPLLARSLPTPGQAAPIEAADIRRVQLEEHVTLPYPVVRPRRRRFSRWHVAFISMILLAVLALTIDGMLLSFAFRRAAHAPLAQAGPPTLLLSANMANPGDVISLQLTHFVSSTSVVLTHDVQETLATTNNQSALTIDANGKASTSFAVTTSWGPGFHLIVAEDVSTRDTASAMLQIAGEGPSRPPHLLLDNASLDLGDAVQGADTIQPLELRNAGSGSISWSASSDQPWLLVAPVQGEFSAGQSIAVAAQRNNLAPGIYSGRITLFSTVGAPETIQVNMKVSALPPDAGPMISLSPPLLAFATTDGSAVPQTQVVTLSNPGQQTLDWSLNIGTTTATTLRSAVVEQPTNQSSPQATDFSSWLSADLHAGQLAPGESVRVRMTTHGQNLLPGAYMVPVSFSAGQAQGAYDNPQVMDVALTVQPHCGLLASTGVLDFTAVTGQNNPSNHTLGLSTTSSCGSGVLDWRAFSSAKWLEVSPQSGQIRGSDGGVTSIGVNTVGLATGKYTGLVTFQAGKSTQTVVVRLTLQPHPAPLEPIMGASPLSLNFSTVQGEADPAGQVVTITNNGGSPLKWHTNVVLLGTTWLSAAPTGGTVPPGQTGQATVTVATAGLTPGTYTGQISLAATDSRGSPASGSPQVVTVNLTVQPPCTLAQPSSSSLLFTAVAGGANPLAQTVTLTSTGSCVWPVHWSTSVSPTAPWLTLSAPTGALTTLTQQGSIAVGVNASGLAPGTYTTQVKLSAVDSAGLAASNSPQMFSVALTVLQACTLQPLPAQIILNASAGQAAVSSQAFTLGETGSCNGGVVWTAASNAASNTWLSLSATAGTDNGSGSSITVSASAGLLAPGNYAGQITLSANNNGVVLQGSPQTVKVLFQVSGYTVSGAVTACVGPAPACTTPQGLGGATVSLVNSNNVTVATVTADSSGNFTFSNIPLGTYTVKASGSANSLSYSGTATVVVSANIGGVKVSAYS